VAAEEVQQVNAELGVKVCFDCLPVPVNEVD